MSVKRGYPQINPSGTPYAPSLAIAALNESPSSVGFSQACENPTEEGDSFSAAIASDGAYGVPEGLICGYPLFTLTDGTVEIKRDQSLSEFAKQKFQISIDELESEREAVKYLLK